MSTEVRTPTGQPHEAGREDTAAGAARENPQTLVQESIKYRRRAQEAERRAEALEAEIQSLRLDGDERSVTLETKLAEAKAEAESLREQLATLDRDRQLERELLRAGCADTETALALARDRLVGAGPPEDLTAFARSLLEEKPHLRGASAGAAAEPPATRGLPPRTAAAKPPGESAPRRVADRMADRARETGSSGDLMAYLRARRGA